MLEVRNLSKIYKAKQKDGADTHALDHVSLRFPEKGMVFLLGKSGSGKSTLLNVCGGLDAPTEGEIIVKGRSSQNFSQSDFDSYRNTFIGFIFQEYNILNEFTVEDNIALALELQGKPKDKKAIAELLEQVDLAGYAKRKPNTLSGGQKQRIAIARALVKAPEIIMADEPTGALDSATGKQVFDTLKKLSKDKLVIVVSHDREFAELYADRIIELKDGRVLSDITKTQEKQKLLSPNVTAIGDVLCIKKGSELTENDFDRIKSMIQNNAGDVIIAGNDQDVQNFKKINRITDKGEKEVFKETDEREIEEKTYTPEQSKFIRSKLPVKHAAKIGVSGLKTKPVRLFFTVVLCVVSFVLFGVLSTLMLYSSEGMFKQTLKDSDHDFVVFDKIYVIENSYYENGAFANSYTDVATARFSSNELKAVSDSFGEGSFGAIDINAQATIRQAPSAFWKTRLVNAAYMPENAFPRHGLNGTYPEKENEICVSTYFADMLMECKPTDKNGAVINLSSRDQLIGKTILLDGYEFKVTGIFDSGVIDQRFEVLKDNTKQDYSLEYEFESLLNDSIHLLVAVSEDGLKWFANRYEHMNDIFASGDDNRRGNAYVDSGSAMQPDGMPPKGSIADKEGVLDGSFEVIMNGSTVYYNPFSSIEQGSYLTLTEGKTSLTDNETIVAFNLFGNSLSSQINAERQSLRVVVETLQNITTKINNIDESISYFRDKLVTVNQEIAQTELALSVMSPESDGYWDLYNYKEMQETDKAQFENEILSLENQKAEAYSELPDGMTPQTFPEKFEEYNTILNKLDELENTINKIRYGEETIYPDGGDPVTKTVSAQERAELLRNLVKNNPELISGFTLKFSLASAHSQTPLTEEKSYTVAGILLPTDTENYYVENSVYFNDQVVDSYWEIQKAGLSYRESSTNYRDEEGAVYTKLYVPYDHSDAQTDYVWSVYSNEEFSTDGSKIEVIGNYVERLQTVDVFVVDFSTIFLYIGLVLAAFAILLFSNFISVSISQKRREIGILRAVGARSFDVFKIFFSESLVIAAICSLLSIIGSALLCQVMNTELGASLGASIFVFGIASVLIIVAIALLTAILATFLPVWNAAKKKPVDSIRAL